MRLMPTTQAEVLQKSPDRVWDIHAVHMLDRDKILAFIKEAARGKINLGAGVQSDEKVDLQRKAAIDQYKLVSQALEQMYDPDQITAVEQILHDAERGLFQRKAPSTAAIWMWSALLVLAGGLEISFFTYMVVAMGAGPALLGLAVLLLVGGLFAGHGIASVMIKSQQDQYEETEHAAEGRYKFLVAVGFVLICSVTGLRFAFGGVLAGITAALFGIAVTTTEAFLNFYRGVRQYYLHLMFRAQRCYAAIQLEKAIKQRGNPNDDTWRMNYVQHIEDAITRFKAVGQSSDELPLDEMVTDDSDKADKVAQLRTVNAGASARSGSKDV